MGCSASTPTRNRLPEAEREEAEALEIDSRAILDRLPESVFVFDAQWRLVYANESAHGRARALGLDGRLIPGRALWEACPELADNGTGEALRRAAELRETVETELQWPDSGLRTRVRLFPCGDGLAVLCPEAGDGTPDEAGEEERLRAYLGMLVEATNDAIVGFDAEFDILSWNRGARDLLGYEEAEIVGRSAYELLPLEHRERARENHRRVARGEELHDYVTRMCTKHGETVYASVSISPVPGVEGGSGYVAVMQDITERRRVEKRLRESEARYRTLFDSIDEAFALCELVFAEDGSPVDYRFLEVNPAFETMTGISTEQAAGRTARELAPEAEEWWLETYERVGLRGESLRFENWAEALGRWLEVYASPVGETGDGRFAIVFQDITGRKNAEAERERLLQREREISLTLQRALLPPSLPEIPGLRLAARYAAASEGMEVGGDLYDVFPLASGGWALVVGDVTGKGPEAASLTSLAHYTLRTASASEAGPAEVVRRLNAEIMRQTDGLKLMTLIFGRLRRTGEGWRLELATGGHPPPLVLRAGGEAETHAPGGMLLGVREEPPISGWSLDLSAGDAIVLYTDGVTEARSPEGEFFGDERLRELCESCAGLSAGEVAERITNEVKDFQGGDPRDDVAVLVLEAVE